MSTGSDRIPDNAFVVRCGKPPYLRLRERCSDHPDGVHGFSVQSAPGQTVELLAAACPNNWVGVTTAARIRQLGYDVVRTSGRQWHATVVVPADWSEDDAFRLSKLFERVRNALPGR